MEIRRRHVLGKMCTRFPSDDEMKCGECEVTEFEHHCNLIGRDPNDIRKLNRPRIWIGHFWEEDLILKRTGDSTFKFVGLVKDKTNYQDKAASTGTMTLRYAYPWYVTHFCHIGVNCFDAPPRPARALAKIQQGAFWNGGRPKKLFRCPVTPERANSATTPASTSISPNPVTLGEPPELGGGIPQVVTDEMKCGECSSDRIDWSGTGRRGPERPGLGKPDYFGTTFDAVIEGIAWPIHAHARACTGTPLFHARDNMTFHGLCGQLRVVCSLGQECECEQWEGGRLLWRSDAVMEIVTSEAKKRIECVLNIKYAVAMAMCPGTKAAGHSLLSNMQLRPRSSAVHDDIIKTLVVPYVMERKADIMEEHFEKLKGKTCVVCVDNCWNHARNAEGATTSLAVDGEVICTFTDKEDLEASLAVAASKEPLLFRLALERVITGEGIDVAAVCIDPNAHNAKMAMEFDRVNAPEELGPIQQNALQVYHDAYHAAAKINKSAATALSAAKFEDFVNRILKKSPGATVGDVAAEAEAMCLILSQRSDGHFADITAAYSDQGGDEWRETCSDAEKMLEFARQNNLLDTPATTNFRPLLEQQNSRRADDKKVHTIERLKLSDSSTTIEDLQNVIVHTTGCDATRDANGKVATWSGQEDLPLPNARKDVLVSYASALLPPECSRGRLISTTWKEATELLKERTTDISSREHIGKKVCKDFEGKMYHGSVSSYVPPYWKVTYDDGDGEDFEEHELKAGMELHARQCSADANTGPATARTRTSTRTGDGTAAAACDDGFA